MLNFYKSKINYCDPTVNFKGWLEHPETHSEEPISMVCPAGNILSLVFGGYLLLREFFVYEYYLYIIGMKLLNLIVLIMSIFLSLMNFNVTIYLTPIFLIEFIRLFC